MVSIFYLFENNSWYGVPEIVRRGPEAGRRHAPEEDTEPPRHPQPPPLLSRVVHTGERLLGHGDAWTNQR